MTNTEISEVKEILLQQLRLLKEHSSNNDFSVIGLAEVSTAMVEIVKELLTL